VASEVTLRVPAREDLDLLCRLAAEGIHPPEHTPFAVPWTDLRGEEFRRAFLNYHEGRAARWQRDGWDVSFAVRVDEVLVGMQAIRGTRTGGDLTVETGSWLGRRYQGRGHGTMMRAAVLELVFAGLGATAAASGAFDRNPASARVSRKLGYHPSGTSFLAPRGYPIRQTVFRIERDTWLAGAARRGVRIEALAACQGLFGLE
jgi:RimJ/RimL family protein N-acetyltransferase